MAITDKLMVHPAILNDRKFGTMPDSLWRCYFELCFLAIDYNRGGDLPPLEDVAWYLHQSPKELFEKLAILKCYDLVENGNNTFWRVNGCEYVDLSNPPDPWHKLRLIILRRDNETCAYCGQPGNHIDHIFPRNLGGEDEPQNLVVACQSCNSSKSDKLICDWYKTQPFFDPSRLERIKAVQNGET